MSFIIVVHVGEGIVLASDSRTTYTNTQILEDKTVVKHVGIHTTDTTDKTFICPNGCGISTCGTSSINSKPITGYIQSFIRENISKETTVESVPELLMQYFRQFDPIPETNFIVAGYDEIEGEMVQRIYRVYIVREEIETINTTAQGASWDGETDVLSRIIQPVAYINPATNQCEPLLHHEILWNFFTLQDAVDFAKYAVETTINTMHFQNRIETVGGEIDILVITPEKTSWLVKKEISTC